MVVAWIPLSAHHLKMEVLPGSHSFDVESFNSSRYC